MSEPQQGTPTERNDAKPECFVIMPISDPDGYAGGHFDRVFRLLFEPACADAGFRAVRATDVKKETDLIHETILRRLLAAPMALCDLSTRNPNVLFELGLRQAFDKPVVLVQQAGTPRIFDIAPLRALDYSPDLRIDNVERERPQIAEFLKNTHRSQQEGSSVNSLVSFLRLTAPAIPKPSTPAGDTDALLRLIRTEIASLRESQRPGDALTEQPHARSDLPGDVDDRRERYLNSSDYLLGDFEARLSGIRLLLASAGDVELRGGRSEVDALFKALERTCRGLGQRLGAGPDQIERESAVATLRAQYEKRRDGA